MVHVLMKRNILLIISLCNVYMIVVAVVAPATTTATTTGVQNEISYEIGWFTQRVDHFSFANKDTFVQRYLYNQQYWCGENCPILFYTGNEGDIEVFANNTGWMWENAKKLQALLVFAEHRYYGQTFPYRIDPSKIRPDELDKLGYLSSEQALADYATLLVELKERRLKSPHSPVIAIGGSYGGMLAAWMRMKYPHLVEGALAASAPILQFPGEYQCNEFNKIVTKDFEHYGAACSRTIARSWQVIRELANTLEGRTRLAKHFNTCDERFDEQDADMLISWLSSIWVNMAMTDYANPATFLAPMPAYPIKHACAHLTNDQESHDELMRHVAAAANVFANSTGQIECLDLSEEMADPMDVMWDFQSCTEMVMPICSDGINDMFEPQAWNMSAYTEMCIQHWGARPDPLRITTNYGKMNMTAYSNIIFSSCSRDPWSAGCPQQSIEANSIIALKIAGVCHHEDLRQSGPGDSNELKAARQTELNIISEWIHKYYTRVKANFGSLVFDDSTSTTGASEQRHTANNRVVPKPGATNFISNNNYNNAISFGNNNNQYLTKQQQQPQMGPRVLYEILNRQFAMH